MFGVLKGMLYIVIGTTLGAALAFMFARHFFGERDSRFILTHSKLKMLNHELSRKVSNDLTQLTLGVHRD